MADPRHGGGHISREAHQTVDHEGPTRASAAALAAGHEPDVLEDKPVWYFYAFLMIGAVLVFGFIVPAIFAAFGPARIPGAAKSFVSVEDRLKNLAGPKGYQPRLDGLEIYKVEEKIDDPVAALGRVDARSYGPAPEGNSPDYKHTDMWPERNALLNRWVGTQVPPQAVYADVLKGGKVKPKEGAKPLPAGETAGVPKESSGGQPPAVTEAPHDDHKEKH